MPLLFFLPSSSLLRIPRFIDLVHVNIQHDDQQLDAIPNQQQYKRCSSPLHLHLPFTISPNPSRTLSIKEMKMILHRKERKKERTLHFNLLRNAHLWPHNIPTQYRFQDPLEPPLSSSLFYYLFLRRAYLCKQAL